MSGACTGIVKFDMSKLGDHTGLGIVEFPQRLSSISVRSGKDFVNMLFSGHIENIYPNIFEIIRVLVSTNTALPSLHSTIITRLVRHKYPREGKLSQPKGC